MSEEFKPKITSESFEKAKSDEKKIANDYEKQISEIERKSSKNFNKAVDKEIRSRAKYPAVTAGCLCIFLHTSARMWKALFSHRYLFLYRLR